MAITLGTGLAAAGGLGSLFGGISANKSQKELSRAQRDIIRQQGQLFATAQPFYSQLLQAYAGRAGLGGDGQGLTQTGPSRYQVGSNFGSPEDQLRLQAAEDDISRYYRQQANQLRHGMGQGSAGLGAALGRLGGQEATQLAQFRRQLAIEAPREEERRLANLTGLLGLGFGQGTQAAGGYGQQAAQFGQQAQQGFAGLGSILQQYQYMQALQNQQQPGLGGTADTYTPAQQAQFRRIAAWGG